MATHTTTSPPDTRTTVDRETLFLSGESNQFLFANDDCITIYSPHMLFDIPVMETYDAFLQALASKNAARTLSNDYDGIDVLCFKAEQALSEVISVNEFEQQSIEYANSQLTDRDVFDEITDFASIWLEEFINEYNRILKDETPEEFEAMQDNAKRLAEKKQVDPELIVRTIAAELDVDPCSST